MTDEISVLDDTPAPAERVRRGLPRPVGVLVVLLVLVLLGAGAVIGGQRVLDVFSSPADYEGSGRGEVVVQVARGATAADIGRALLDAGIVKSVGAFTDAARDDQRSLGIQPGFYRLRLEMSAKSALGLLLDPKARVRSRFTIPEGTTVARTLEIIAKSVEKMPLASLRQAAANPAALGLPAYARNRLEGFLFPATYDVEPGTSAVEVLTMMVNRFKQAAAATGLEDRAGALGVSPYEALIIASLVEGETPKDDQRGKVSRVVYNRLKKGMRLEFDSTVKYAYLLRGEVKTRLLFRDLDISSPYNTYRRSGLPPTPISSPGEAALAATMEPEAGSWLYFVVIDKQGNSAFTDSYDEFLRFKERYRREVLGEG